MALIAKADEVLVAKGKKLLRFSPSADDSDAIAGAILGRSGTLRAPAIRVGKTFLVGFNPEAYSEVFAS